MIRSIDRCTNIAPIRFPRQPLVQMPTFGRADSQMFRPLFYPWVGIAIRGRKPFATDSTSCESAIIFGFGTLPEFAQERMMKRYAVTLCVLFACPFAVAGDAIEIDGGKISGTVQDGIHTFKGIPYAAPPVGDLRWRAPQPVVPWDGVRKCDQFSAICPQADYPAGSIYRSAPQPKDEDCLYLNVWAPEKASTEKLPVMVWIHGGAWTRGSGSNPVYDGAALAKRGVVLVTINYRLGAFGFLSHPELTKESEHGVSGNQGILDSIAALQWVNRNIAKFGGDPNNVLIFGESAGSWSVNVLVASPLTVGLVHRAIGQSGARFGTAPHLTESSGDTKSAHDLGLEFATACGAESLAELRKLPAEEILKARFRTQLTVDGRVFPDQIASIYAAGKQNKVPAIVGSNADEMTSLSNPATNPKTLDAVTKVLGQRYGAEGVEKFKQIYGVTDDATAARAFLHAGGDRAFAIGMRQWARFNDKAGTDSYLYYFTHSPPGIGSEYLRAHHAAEIAYAFDNAVSSERRPYTDADQKLADQVADYWVNFARTGNPNGQGLPEWPEYDSDTEGYIELDGSVEAKQNLLKTRLDFLEAVAAGK